MNTPEPTGPRKITTAPAETGTPTPEYSTPLQIADAFGGCYTAFDVCGCADAIQRLIDQQLAAMTRERDEARRERDDYHKKDCDIADQRDRANDAIATLRHSLAAAEALLEARTRALEGGLEAMRSVSCILHELEARGVELSKVNLRQWERATALEQAGCAALSLTPEQAWKEKEGAS